MWCVIVVAKTLTAKILVYLSENPGATIKDLSQVFNVNPNTIRNMIYRLRNNGYVEKAGNGYVLTSKGEWFVSKILKKEEVSESQEQVVVEGTEKKAGEESVHVHREVVETPKKQEVKQVVSGEDIVKRISELEKEIEAIKKVIEDISREISELKEKIGVGRKSVESRDREKKVEGLPKPVMNVREAMDTLGPLFDQLRLEGRIEIIGSIVVDKEFYEEFKKKFPIPIKEAENLSPLEKMLLNEMIKDARVIIHAGKHYKLIS